MKEWLLIGAVVLLALIVIALLLYLFTLRRSLREVGEQMREKLETDTNTLLSISTGDSRVRALAAELNRQLGALRRERLRLRHGDLELKEAVTNISHDLRTPLTAISGYLDLLEQEKLPEPAGRYFSVIRERTNALTVLSEELFRYSVVVSTAEDLTLEDVCLNHVLEESLAAFYGAFSEAGIVPELHITEQKIIRRLDRAALQRIYGNILNNVLKYSAGDLSVTLAPEGTLTFSNTAPGLDRVQAEKLFDRFYTVSSAQNATGLGLSIARLLTERMGGRITSGYEGGILQIFLDFPKGPDQTDQ